MVEGLRGSEGTGNLVDSNLIFLVESLGASVGEKLSLRVDLVVAGIVGGVDREGCVRRPKGVVEISSIGGSSQRLVRRRTLRA